MSIDEAIERLGVLRNLIETELEGISQEIAVTGMGMIVNRIQQEGLEGRRYSEQKLPVFYFENKDSRKEGKSRIKSAKKRKEGISYKEWRELNGLQTNIVDLTFSGRMFQSVGPISTVRNGNTVVTVIGGDDRLDKTTKDKLRWNAQRFGDYFNVTDKEREELKELFKSKVSALVKQVGL